MSGEFTVSCAQFTAVDGEKQGTIDRALHRVQQAGERGSKVVVLPEVWTGLGYSDNAIYRDIAETIPGPTTDLLSRAARRYGMYIPDSMYQSAGGGGAYHNSIGFGGRSLVIDPWGTITATASDAGTCLSGTIDPAFVDEVRQRYPLLHQRRPELYPSIGTQHLQRAAAE